VRFLAAALKRVHAGAQHVGLDLRRLDAPEERAAAGDVRVSSASSASYVPPSFRLRPHAR
jgi:hypothetical protein